MAVVLVNRRPGPLWAVVQFPLTRIAVFFALLLAAIVCAQSPEMFGVAPHSLSAVAASLLIALASAGLYCALVRLIERRPVTEFALPGAAAGFGIGAAIGGVLFALTIAVLIVSGVASVGRGGAASALAEALAAALVAAVMEELLLRGVLFRVVEESLGSWIALALSALVFGGLHAFNQGATPTSTLAIALEAGVLLASVYMYTRTLWMPIGLHLGWNFTEGGIFGASVSGGRAQGWLATHLAGSDLLTGGTFGPEASLVAVIVCLAAGAVFLVLAARKRHVVAPFWRRRP